MFINIDQCNHEYRMERKNKINESIKEMMDIKDKELKDMSMDELVLFREEMVRNNQTMPIHVEATEEELVLEDRSYGEILNELISPKGIITDLIPALLSIGAVVLVIGSVKDLLFI